MYKVSDLSMEYRKKLITADQAAAMVKNGDRLHFGLGCGSIIDIDKAIAKRADVRSRSAKNRLKPIWRPRVTIRFVSRRRISTSMTET